MVRMTRVAILAYGAHLQNPPDNLFSDALEPQIDRAFAPLRAQIADPTRVAISFTSSKGDWTKLQNGDFLNALPDAPALNLVRRFGTLGRIAAPNAACASGAHAIALGAQWIADGHADLVLTGALEPPQHPMITAAYRNMGALSKSGVMRPFDARRDGFVVNAGGGFVVLARDGWAHQNGAPIQAYLGGWSFDCDAAHITQMAPSGASIERAIRQSLQMAGDPNIDYINAHGTATLNDITEARALNRVFGGGVAVSSTKPQTGHLMGAAGALEAVLCLDAMRNQVAPPTLNLQNVDDEVDLDLVVGQGRSMKIGASLSLNYGFGGHIGCLVLLK